MMLHRADVLKIQEMDARMIDEYHLDGSLPIISGSLQVSLTKFSANLLGRKAVALELPENDSASSIQSR